MKRWRIWAAYSVVVLLAAVGIAAMYVWWLADPGVVSRDQRVATVEKGSLVVTIRAIGAVVVPENKALSFGVGGVMDSLYVSEGDVVLPGAPLAQLDTNALELAVDQAAVDVSVAEKRLTQANEGPLPAEIAAAHEALAAAQAAYDHIKAGPLAAEIDSAEAALSSAEASYQQLLAGPSEDELLVLKANLDKAEITLRQAQGDYDRYAWRAGFSASPQAAALEKATIDHAQALASYNLASAGPTDEQVERAQAEIARARAQLERLRSSGGSDALATAAANIAAARAVIARLESLPSPQAIAIAEAQTEQARLRHDLAEQALTRGILISPVGGTVLDTHAAEGQAVSAFAPIVTVIDLAQPTLEVLVHETLINRVQVGQRARVRFDALPDREFEGSVLEIDPLPSASSGTVAYPVEIALSAQRPDIKPGMVARVEIVAAEHRDALLLPKGALSRQGGQWTAAVVRDRVPVDVAVTIGEKQGRTVRVIEGLAEGDQVLLNAVPPSLSAVAGAGWFARGGND